MYVFVGDPLGEITVLTPNLTTPFHTQTNYAQTTFVQHCVYVTHYCGPSVSARVCVLIRFSCKKTDQRVSHTSVDHIRTHTHKHIRTHCQLYRKREICTFACKNFRGLVVQLYACILRSWPHTYTHCTHKCICNTHPCTLALAHTHSQTPTHNGKPHAAATASVHHPHLAARKVFALPSWTLPNAHFCILL